MLTSDTAVMSGVRRMVMLVRRAGHTHTAAAAAGGTGHAPLPHITPPLRTSTAYIAGASGGA